MAKKWGALGWIQPLIDIMMAGASETTGYYLSRMFSARRIADSYIRIQPASMGNPSVDMDKATKEIATFIILITTYIGANSKYLGHLK